MLLIVLVGSKHAVIEKSIPIEDDFHVRVELFQLLGLLLNPIFRVFELSDYPAVLTAGLCRLAPAGGCDHGDNGQR